MALGIALSSLDVVVGISGVHYVTQGLRQIDRELDVTNAKRVKVALEYPDLSGQLGNIQKAGLQSTAALAGVGREMTNLARLSTQLAANPLKVADARSTIRQATEAAAAADMAKQAYQGAQRATRDANMEVRLGLEELRETQVDARIAGQAVRDASNIARAATRQATLDQQAYNKALAAEGVEAKSVAALQTQRAAALRANAIQAMRDITAEVEQGSVVGIRAARVIADPTATLGAKAIAQQQLDDRVAAAAYQRVQKQQALQREALRLTNEITAAQARQAAAHATTLTTQTAAQRSTRSATLANAVAAQARQDKDIADQFVDNARIRVNALRVTANAAGAFAASLGDAYQVARAKATDLGQAAKGAAQYLASVAIVADPLKVLFNIVTGGIGAVVALGGHLFDLGKGIVGLGGAALGALGHVAGFVGNIISLPIIAGPATAGLSLIADNFMKIVTAIGLVVGALAGLSFKEIIQEGMSFEQATANIGAVAQYSFLTPKDKAPPGSVATSGPLMLDVPGLKEQLQELDYITLKLGADTVFSNTEVAQGIELLIRGGTNAKDVSETAVRAMLNLATATGGSIEASAGAINDLLGIFSLGADQIPHAADVIAGAINTSRMDLNDWTSAMRQVAPLGQAIGLSFEDLATGLTLLGQKGFRGELAGTAFRNMLLYINPRSDPAKEELKKLGLWTDTGMSPVDPEDPAVISFNDKQRAGTRRLAQLQQQLAQQQSAAKPNQSAIMSTQNQIQTLKDQLAHAVAPGSKATGHSAFYDDMGNLLPLDQIIQKLADVSQGMNDVEKSEFYQKVFGTRSGSAALLFSKDDAETFRQTKDLIGSLNVQTLANFKLDTVAGAIELLTGSLKSLASVVFVNWLASPLKSFIMGLVGPVNSFLELMGKVQKGNGLSALFGERTRGQMGLDQLTLQLRTGNFDAFKGNILAIFPALQRFQGFLYPIFRTLQTGRDIVITFAQALRGEWAGAFTDSINPIVRLAGIWGTYWGKIWRGLLDLIQGKISFSTFISQVVDGFMTLLTQVGTLITTQGPGLVTLLKQALGWGEDLGKDLWDSTLKPGLDYMYTQLNGWWQANRGAIGQGVGSLVDLILHGSHKQGTDLRKGVTVADNLGQVSVPPKELADTPGLMDLIGGMFSGLGTIVSDHKEDLIGAGRMLGQLLLEGFDLVWSDEGIGLGRHLARGIASTFADLGKGLMGADQGIGDFWTNIFQPGSGAGSKPGGKPDTGVGQEFKRAFLLLAVDIVLILDLILSSMFNLILLNLKTMIQTIVDITLLMTMGILEIISKVPGMGPTAHKALEDLNTLHTDIQRGIDLSFPMVKPGAMTEGLFGGKGALDQILNGELVDANGVILTGPNRGKVLGPDGNPVEQTGGAVGGGPAPGTTVTPASTGAESTPRTQVSPGNPRQPQRVDDSPPTGPQGPGSTNITADRIVIEARGLGVDEVIDQLYMGLKAKFEAMG